MVSPTTSATRPTTSPGRHPTSGEFSSILRTCDLFTILLAGLTGAAENLTPENFIAALETAGEIELVGSANGSFSADDPLARRRVPNHPVGRGRVRGWRATSDFVPMAAGG